MPNVIENAQLLAHATREAAQAIGLEVFAKRPGSSVTALKSPAGLDSKVIVKGFRGAVRRGDSERPGHYAGPDFPPCASRLFRLRGHVRDRRGTRIDFLRANGHKVELGKGVAAVQRVYEEAKVRFEKSIRRRESQEN